MKENKFYVTRTYWNWGPSIKQTIKIVIPFLQKSIKYGGAFPPTLYKFPQRNGEAKQKTRTTVWKTKRPRPLTVDCFYRKIKREREEKRHYPPESNNQYTQLSKNTAQ